MLRRHLCLARALSAAGVLALMASASGARAEAPEPLPGDDSAPQTIGVLKAEQAGAIRLTIRGNGPDRVKFTIQNTSPRRLNVVLPPGLVASSAVAQGGGGFQSMGLGTPTNRPGSFGEFQGSASGDGFRSVPVDGEKPMPGIVVSSGKTVDVVVPSVCLNFGIPTPTPRDVFRLVTIEDYTPDARARKALKSLATLGTSQGVAQAVMWHVCNGMSSAQLASQAAKYVNMQEIGLAAKFVEALDASPGDLVDPAYLQQARVLVRIHGDGTLAKDAKRLAGELDGQTLLGLPIRLVDDLPVPEAHPSALLLNVALTNSGTSQTRGRVNVVHNSILHGWVPLGNLTFQVGTPSSSLAAAELSKELDRSVAAAFVSVRPARKVTGGTVVKIDNRLPFTIANATLRIGRDRDSEGMSLDRLGLGPARSTTAQVPAAGATVENVILNGL